MRYIEVTHTYTLPVPADDVEAIDAIATQGISIMEEFMQHRAANISNLRSHWTMMPREYGPVQPIQDLIVSNQGDPGDEHQELMFTDTPHERDRLMTLRIIEADADAGVSFTGDIMGQGSGPPPHPWDQGIRVTPPGHDYFEAETAALRQENMLCGAEDGAAECVLVKGHPGDHLMERKPTYLIPKEITDGE